MQLVLVESDVEAAIRVARALLAHDHSVAVAHGGRDGLRRLQERTAALLIVACTLPDIDGTAVIAQARARRYYGPTLLLTEGIIAPRAGMDECLAKPFAIPELLSSVNALLRRPWVIA